MIISPDDLLFNCLKYEIFLKEMRTNRDTFVLI